MASNKRFGELVEEQLKKFGSSKENVYHALSEVLPFSKSVIEGNLSHYSQGWLLYPHATNHRSCLSSEEKRSRRSQLLYSLGVEEDSELIGVLRELDPKTEYPPENKPQQISLQQVQKHATLKQKINYLSGPRRAQVEDLVGRLYLEQITPK